MRLPAKRVKKECKQKLRKNLLAWTGIEPLLDLSSSWWLHRLYRSRPFSWIDDDPNTHFPNGFFEKIFFPNVYSWKRVSAAVGSFIFPVMTSTAVSSRSGGCVCSDSFSPFWYHHLAIVSGLQSHRSAFTLTTSKIFAIPVRLVLQGHMKPSRWSFPQITSPSICFLV